MGIPNWNWVSTPYENTMSKSETKGNTEKHNQQLRVLVHQSTTWYYTKYYQVPWYKTTRSLISIKDEQKQLKWQARRNYILNLLSHNEKVKKLRSTLLRLSPIFDSVQSFFLVVRFFEQFFLCKRGRETSKNPAAADSTHLMPVQMAAAYWSQLHAKAALVWP